MKVYLTSLDGMRSALAEELIRRGFKVRIIEESLHEKLEEQSCGYWSPESGQPQEPDSLTAGQYYQKRRKRPSDPCEMLEPYHKPKSSEDRLGEKMNVTQ